MVRRRSGQGLIDHYVRLDDWSGRDGMFGSSLGCQDRFMAKRLLDNAEAELLGWESDFREGKVHRPLLAPHPEGDERWGAKISRAGLVPLAAYEFEDPGLIIVEASTG